MPSGDVRVAAAPSGNAGRAIRMPAEPVLARRGESPTAPARECRYRLAVGPSTYEGLDMLRFAVVTTAAAMLLVGWGAETTAPTVLDISSSVVVIQSASGVSAVSPTGPFTVTFDHAMIHAETMKIVLREGDRGGPVIAASATWSQDRTALTVAPGAALKSRVQYTVELQCNGMSGQNGASHDAHHGSASGMMGGSHGSMHGSGGMMGGQGMMGAHGMTFSFTTS